MSALEVDAFLEAFPACVLEIISDDHDAYEAWCDWNDRRDVDEDGW